LTDSIYQHYFGLTDPPFSITPDPRFVYLSPRHEDALAHLRYGIGQGGGGGFVQLTGEVGTGKTTLCRLLLDQLPDDTRVALILNPRLNPLELLEKVCDELKISTRGCKGSEKRLVDKLNGFLLGAHGEGLTVVLIIDEAQNLSPEALEQVRLLTNLETATQKLLQIVFLGQPELRDLLSRSDLRQLAQRITARFHLGPLDAEETAAYTGHRLTVAGAGGNPFTRAAMKTLYQTSGGVPRLINVIAERSLLAAYAYDRGRIDPATVRQAASEVLGEVPTSSHRFRWAGAAGGVLLAIWLGLTWLPRLATTEPTVSPPMPEPVATVVDVAAKAEPAAQIESPPPEPPPVVVEPPHSESFEQAWQRLFELRGLGSPAPQQDRCPLRLGGSLFCLEGRGSLYHLRELGRPVVVEMPSLALGYAVLDARGEALSLIEKDGPRRIERGRLEQHWNGRYWDVWRMPAYVPTLLSEGDRGPGVLWIKGAAARARPPYSQTVDDPYFGPSLRRWAESFQQRIGLQADGLIGPETLQALSRYGSQVAG
jgi:general secretion pathway protein A